MGSLTPDSCFLIKLPSLAGGVAVSFMQKTIYSHEKLSEDLDNEKELFPYSKYLCYTVFWVKYRSATFFLDKWWQIDASSLVLRFRDG